MITGVLESIEREEAKSLIERYGGKVTGNVSKKTNYLVMGRDSGQSKSDKVGPAGALHSSTCLPVWLFVVMLLATLQLKKKRKNAFTL